MEKIMDTQQEYDDASSIIIRKVWEILRTETSVPTRPSTPSGTAAAPLASTLITGDGVIPAFCPTSGSGTKSIRDGWKKSKTIIPPSFRSSKPPVPATVKASPPFYVSSVFGFLRCTAFSNPQAAFIFIATIMPMLTSECVWMRFLARRILEMK